MARAVQSKVTLFIWTFSPSAHLISPIWTFVDHIWALFLIPTQYSPHSKCAILKPNKTFHHRPDIHPVWKFRRKVNLLANIVQVWLHHLWWHFPFVNSHHPSHWEKHKMKLFKVALYVWDLSECWPYGEEVGEEGDQDDNEEDDQNPYLLKAGSLSC